MKTLNWPSDQVQGSAVCVALEQFEDLKLLKAVAINKRSVLQRVGAVEGECPVDVNIITDYECHS